MEGEFLTAAEFREVMRESTLRFERAMRALAAEIRRDVEAHREESRRYFEEIRDENRAHQDALFRILDRLDNGGGSAAAG